MIDNRRGFTLVEFLVAIVILMVGMLGMLQAINIAMEKNLENVFRTEAVTLAEERMMEARTQLTSFIPVTMVQRRARGVLKNYSVWQNVNSVAGKSNEVVIVVKWHNKNSSASHTASSLITNPY